jgi:RHS repeat-associated protein
VPTTTNYIWDEQNYLAETDGDNVVQTMYTNEPEQYGNLISSRISGTTSYHHFDAIGSTRQVTNAAGSVTDSMIYDAWGNIINRMGVTSIAFLWVAQFEYYFDAEIALVYVRARNYSAAIARWTCVDPLRMDDFLVTSLLSPFAYAGNASVRLTDPSGAINITWSHGPIPGETSNDPPNLNALYNVNGIDFNKLYLQDTSAFLTFLCTGCGEKQRYGFQFIALDIWQISNGALDDKHLLDVEKSCALGPGSSKCCTSGTWKANISYLFSKGTYVGSRGTAGEWPDDVNQTFKNLSIFVTDCSGNPEGIVHTDRALTRFLSRLRRTKSALLKKFLLKAEDGADGTFTVKDGMCSVTATTDWQHPDYEPV